MVTRLTRIAYAKYAQSEKIATDATTSLQMFAEKDLIPQLDPDSRDSNQFRKDFLYNEAMDNVYRSNVLTLQGGGSGFQPSACDHMVRRMTLKDWLHVWTH